MYRNRVSLGSLAASTAMICVLSLTPLAVSPDGGFFDLPLAHAQCCFTAETHVLMADGTERQITGIRPGDQVIGRAGGVNRVTGMHIVPLGRRALFGINQHQPFFTAENSSRATTALSPSTARSASIWRIPCFAPLIAWLRTSLR